MAGRRTVTMSTEAGPGWAASLRRVLGAVIILWALGALATNPPAGFYEFLGKLMPAALMVVLGHRLYAR